MSEVATEQNVPAAPRSVISGVKIPRAVEGTVAQGTSDNDLSQPANDVSPLSLPAPAPTNSTEEAPAAPDPAVPGNPLEKYSLLGHTRELEEMAVGATPLLGGVVLRGQATMIYAHPNTGKTLMMVHLIAEAVREKRQAGQAVFYINGDDNSAGLAEKGRIFEDLGVHMLAPGLRGFKSSDVESLLHAAADGGTARGSVVVLDTVKKAANLMNKNESRDFGTAVRAFVARGGTFVGLAHANKRLGPDGKPVYSGTSDMVDDVDAACLLLPLDADLPNEKVVQFDFFKRRGANRNDAFAYRSSETESYDELLASVRPIDPGNLEQIGAQAQEQSDEQVIEAIRGSIRDGVVKKTELAAEAAQRAGVSGKRAARVLERYQNSDSQPQHWDFDRQARGANVYRLLDG